MLAIWDSNGRCVHANRTLEHVLGWDTRAELVHEVFGACHPDPLDRREILAALRAGYEGWRDFRVRTRWGHDLDTRWAVLRLSASSRLGIGEDVSRRKEDEERLREQAAVLDGARDAIIVCDRENRIISWNRGAERLYGWAAVEVLGLRLGGVVEREEHERERPRIDAALLERGEWHGELEQPGRVRRPGPVAGHGGREPAQPDAAEPVRQRPRCHAGRWDAGGTG